MDVHPFPGSTGGFFSCFFFFFPLLPTACPRISGCSGCVQHVHIRSYARLLLVPPLSGHKTIIRCLTQVIVFVQRIYNKAGSDILWHWGRVRPLSSCQPAKRLRHVFGEELIATLLWRQVTYIKVYCIPNLLILVSFLNMFHIHPHY